MSERVPVVVVVCAVAVACVLVSGKMCPSRPDVTLVPTGLPLPILEPPKSRPASTPTPGLAADPAGYETGSALVTPKTTSQPTVSHPHHPAVPSTATPSTQPASRIGAALYGCDRAGLPIADPI